MPRYDPTGHAILSEAAAQLSEGARAAHAATAELLLGRGNTRLADTEFEDGSSEHARAVLAVAHQVNYQVAAGVDAEVFSVQTRGGRSSTFRGGVLAGMPLVSFRAQAIVDSLISVEAESSAWSIAGGLR